MTLGFGKAISFTTSLETPLTPSGGHSILESSSIAWDSISSHGLVHIDHFLTIPVSLSWSEFLHLGPIMGPHLPASPSLQQSQFLSSISLYFPLPLTPSPRFHSFLHIFPYIAAKDVQSLNPWGRADTWKIWDRAMAGEGQSHLQTTRAETSHFLYRWTNFPNHWNFWANTWENSHVLSQADLIFYSYFSSPCGYFYVTYSC